MIGETYEEFVNKFKKKPKLTTDDCMTPPEVYEIVKDWACKEYGIDEDCIVRPFWPGGDYEHFDYPEGCVVLDNPPFSILSKIKRFYMKHGIPFFLFAPGKTLLSTKGCLDVTSIVVDGKITYENGAEVLTGFVTNLGLDGVTLRTSVELANRLQEYKRQNKKKTGKAIRHVYPKNVISSAKINQFARYDRDVKIHRWECEWTKQLDEQNEFSMGNDRKETIFGGGLLISDQKADELLQIREEKDSMLYKKWNLSDREKEIVEALSETPER